MRLEEPALAHGAEGRRPEPGPEAGVADRGRHRPEPARELLVRLEPVPHSALVAVVELDEVDRDLAARLRERLEVPEERLLGDLVEEVVPGAPAGLEARAGACACTAAVLGREALEERRGVAAERDAHALDVECFARRERDLEAHLDLDAHCVRLAQQVDKRGAAPGLHRAREARGAPAARPGDAHEVRLVPAATVLRRSRHRMVEPAQPRTRRERGLARRVELLRARVRPRLPAVLQEAQRAGRGPEPAEAEHDGLDAHRRPSGVPDAQVEARGLALRVDGEPRLERAEPLRPGAEHALGEDERGNAAVIATLGCGAVGVTETEADRLDPAGGVVVGDDARAGHGRGVYGMRGAALRARGRIDP